MVTMVTAGFDYNWISGTSNVGLKLVYEFVMAMDDDFIYAVLDIVDAAEPDAIKVKEMILLVADFIGTFQTDQAALLAELAAYFPEADVEIMFDSIVASLGDFITLAGAPVEVVAMVELITANLNYQLVSGAADVVGELGYNLFNYFLTSEGYLIDLIVIQSGFEQNWNELTSEWEYSNKYTSTQYINQTEWILAQNQSMLVIIDEVFNYADAVMSDLSPADIDALVALIVGVVPESVVMEMSGLTSEQVSAFGILLGQAITNQSGNVLAFLNALIDYVIINNVLDEVGIKQAAIAAYFQDTYGPDYYNNMSWYFADDPYESLVMVIFVSGEIYDFMDVTNKGYADAVIAEVFDFIGAPAVMAYLGETTEHVDAMEVDVNEFVTDVLGYAAVIKDYDVATLGDPEMTTIGELMALIDLWLSPDTPEAPVVK
jgi:hypothetical protein